MNVYSVVSEFRFDVASAIYNAESLKTTVQGLSDTVSNAINTVKASGISMMMQLTGAQAGFMGLLKSSIGASDKFFQGQLSFAQIIDANIDVFDQQNGRIMTMNDKLLIGKGIMEDIAADADKFGLDSGVLYEQTKQLSAMLVRHGLAGQNFEEARNLGRNLLKSSGILGIDPQEVQGQLLRAIGGQASMGDTMFRRLVSEAPEAFGSITEKGGGKAGAAAAFNAKSMKDRFDILSKSMLKFSSNMDILKERANSLDGIMTRLRNTFFGLNSILKPIGDVFKPILVGIANVFLDWVNKDGRKIVKLFSAYLGEFTKNPKQALLAIMQLRDLSKDINRANKLTQVSFVTSFLLSIPLVGKALSWLGGIIVKTLIPAGLLIGGTFSIIGKIFMWMLPALKWIALGLLEYGVVLLGFTILLQGFGRALDRAKLDFVEWIKDNAAFLSEMFASIGNSIAVILSPIQDAIKGWEEIFYSIIGGTYILDAFKFVLKAVSDSLKVISNDFMIFYGIFRGIIAGVTAMLTTMVMNVMTLISNFQKGKFLNLTEGTMPIMGNGIEAFTDEFLKTFNRSQTPLMLDGKDKSLTPGMNTYNDITMNNNFKEVLQPDRIAFTIQSQLEKASVNKTGKRVSGTAATQAKAVN